MLHMFGRTMSFEELLQRANSEPNYEQLQKGLLYIVQTTHDLYYIARFIEPFLPHVDSGSMYTFHTMLQNGANSIYLFPGLIHNVINDCRTNDRLLQLVQVIVKKYL